MSRYFYLIVLILFINGCATLPSSYWEYRSNQTSGSWVTREIEDVLDGNWKRSTVKFERGFLKSDAFIQVDTYANGNTSIGIRNGDPYICDFDTTIRVKFENMPVETFRSYHWNLSKDNTVFWLDDRIDTVKAPFLNDLELYDSVIIETRDGCGTNTQMKFDITGAPHTVARLIRPE